MKISDALKACVDERHLLKHPFYLAWTEGKLPKETLAEYARQYFHHVARFPRYLSAIHSRCPEMKARKVLLENLVDEELHGTDHPELWLQFAEGIGADRASVMATTLWPETQNLLQTFSRLTEGAWTSGLGALFAYESQVPSVAASKVEGLERHYGVTDERSLAFFRVHQQYDVAHTAAVGALVDAHATSEEAGAACQEAADALWTFLDGACRHMATA